MWFLALVVGALLFSVFRLTTRYFYGRKSQRLLLLDLAGSLVAGLALARFWFFTEAAGLYIPLAGLGIAVFLFVFSALAMAEILRKRQQRDYDGRLATLRTKEQAFLRDLESVTRQVRTELRRREEVEGAGRTREPDLEDYRDRVDRWQRGSGAARIRTIKVEEWDQEFRRMDSGELSARRTALDKELRETTDPERCSQLEAMLALAALVTGGGEAGGVPSGSDGTDQVITDMAQRRRKTEAELAIIRADISEWQRRLSDFLSKEIRLD